MSHYDKTAEEMKRQSEGPKRFVKGAISTGAALGGAAAFAPMLARAAPFLSQYIPEDLAIKGLSKVHPNFGKFVKNALNSGYDFSEVKNFLGKQITDSQAATDDKNIIEQYSPELHSFIKDKVGAGEDPVKAGAAAIFDKRRNFEKTIRQIEKEHKTPWSALVQAIYGSGKGNKSSYNSPEEAMEGNIKRAQQRKPSFADQEGDRFQGAYGSQEMAQGSQQPGSGQQALMDILAKINQKLGQ